MESYIQQLFNYMKWQHQEITNLQASIVNLSKEITILKEKPAITVERLEYKFDQLKVETLEGTLNIGLNPSDLNNIDDFYVNPAITNGNQVNKNSPLKKDLLNWIKHYINQNLQKVIHDTEKQLGTKLEPQYIQLIEEDILKQIPARIDHYIDFFNSQVNENMTEEQLRDQIYNKIIADIQQGIHIFIQQMLTHRKDG